MQYELIDISEVCRMFGGVNPSTIYRWVKAQRVPRPLKVGPGTSRWVRSEIEAALAALAVRR